MDRPISKLIAGETATEKELEMYSDCELKSLLLGKEVKPEYEITKAFIAAKEKTNS